MPNEVAPWEEANNLEPFDVVVPKGTDPTAMAKDIIDYKITPQPLKTETAPWGDETPPWGETKPVTPKVTPKVSKREKTLTDKVLDFASKYLGDQTPAEEGSGEATKSFVQGLASVASGGASWIPAGLSMTPITIEGKQGGGGQIKLRSPQEMADTARAIQESLTYTPKDKSARGFAETLARPITYAIEKGKDSGDYYKKLGDEAEARGEHKTAKLLWALGGATEVGGEALPFLIPAGAKAIKENITPPKIGEIVPKEQGKPTSITPDVSTELKALKGEENATQKGKVEVDNISEYKGTDKVGTKAETGGSDSVESIPKTEEALIAEARKYKSAEPAVEGKQPWKTGRHDHIITNGEWDIEAIRKPDSSTAYRVKNNETLEYLDNKGDLYFSNLDTAKKAIQEGVKAEIPKAVEPLIEEARKYKSAEEFVEAITGELNKGQKAEYVANENEILLLRDLANKKVERGEVVPEEIKQKALRFSERNLEIIQEARDKGKNFRDIYNNQLPEQFKNYGVKKNEWDLHKADLISIWNKAHEGKKKVEIKAEEPIASVEKVEPTQTSQVEKPIEQAKNEGKPAKAALDINQDLIDKGFEGVPERDLASYNPMMAKEEVAKVLKYSDREDFYDMAKSNKPMPEDVHPQILFNIAVDKATKAGDINTLMDLAKSPIAEQRSVAAQTLRMSQEGKPTNNVVTKIQEVKKSWESKIKDEKVAHRTRKSIYEEVKKTNLPKEELVWDKFLETIKC